MSVAVLNTDASLTGKTLMAKEVSETITGVKTFDLDPSAPFVVTGGSAVVTNLDADKVDGADYATGSWIPAIASSGGGTATYTTQNGVYVKIGKMVSVSLRIDLATKGTLGAGTVTITGLPFAAHATPYHALAVGGYTLTTAIVWMDTFISPGASIISITINTAAAVGGALLTVADMSATSAFVIGGTYIAAS